MNFTAKVTSDGVVFVSSDKKTGHFKRTSKGWEFDTSYYNSSFNLKELNEIYEWLHERGPTDKEVKIAKLKGSLKSKKQQLNTSKKIYRNWLNSIANYENSYEKDLEYWKKYREQTLKNYKLNLDRELKNLQKYESEIAKIEKQLKELKE